MPTVWEEAAVWNDRISKPPKFDASMGQTAGFRGPSKRPETKVSNSLGRSMVQVAVTGTSTGGPKNQQAKWN